MQITETTSILFLIVFLKAIFEPRGEIGAIAPPKTYESNFIHHDFVQFGKQHSRYKVILSSIILSQQCCEVYFISLTVTKPLWDSTSKYYWNRLPPNTMAASAPDLSRT